MPNDGTAKAWITSAPMTWTRTTLLTGTTSLVVDREQARLVGLALVVLQHQRVELELAVPG